MKCCLCQQDKPVEEFFQDTSGAYSKACRQCAFEGQQKKQSVVETAERAQRFGEKGELFCNVCYRWLFKERFYKNNNMKFGYSYTCKGCMRQMFRNVRAKNKEKNLVKEKVDERKPVTVPNIINTPEPGDLRSQILKRKPLRPGNT